MVYILTCRDKANLVFIHHHWSLKSEAEVIDVIASKHGWEVLDVTVVSTFTFIRRRLFGAVSSATTVPISALISFYRQFAMMQENHVNLNVSLDLCAKSADNKKMAGVCEAILSDIRNGRPMADAFASFPLIFDRMSAAMINAGIKSTSLAPTLTGLAASSELSYEMDKKLNNAAIYPMITMTIAIVVLIIFSYFVIPKFMPIYNAIPGGLPLPTKGLVALSGFMTNNPWIVVLLVAIPIVFFKKKRDIARSTFMQNLFHKLPGIGKLTKSVYMAKYLRMLGQLSEADLPMLQQIRILEEASAVRMYRDAWRAIAEDIENGNNLSDAFDRQSHVLPPMVIGNIRAAEKSGEVAKAANFLADFYTREVRLGIANIQVLIEPIFVVLISGFVGFLLFGMFLPLFDITKVIQ